MIDFKNDIEKYYELEIETIKKLDKEEMSKAMNALVKHYDDQSTIYVFGNGGSAATASHMVCDFNKGVCSKLEKRFKFVCLNDNVPIMTAIANDTTFEDVFYYQLENRLKKEDLVLAISGSGNSKNIMKAAEHAKKVGAEILSVTGYDGGKLAKIADYHLHAPVDDIQVAEDLHMTFDHVIMQILWRYLSKREGIEATYTPNK